MNDTAEQFEKYTGEDSMVDLKVLAPNAKVICAKAFLSCRQVEKLILPDSLEEIQDWAFAHMKRLTEIVFPAKNLLFGKQIFLGCEHLERISFHDLSMVPGFSSYLADSFRYFPEQAPADFSSFRTTDGQITWLAKYDELLADFLQSPDDKGFVAAFIGWFDVEDVDDQKIRYMHSRKVEKILLAYRRLQHSVIPSACKCHDNCSEYIRTSTDLLIPLISQGSFPEKNNIAFYKIWHDSRGLTSEIASNLLESENLTDPEVRNYLIEITMETGDTDNFFNDLEL